LNLEFNPQSGHQKSILIFPNLLFLGVISLMVEGVGVLTREHCFALHEADVSRCRCRASCNAPELLWPAVCAWEEEEAWSSKLLFCSCTQRLRTSELSIFWHYFVSYFREASNLSHKITARPRWADHHICKAFIAS